MERFIKCPNMPKNNVSLAIVDGRISLDMEKELYKREIDIIKTEKINNVYDDIAYHPDIMLCHIGEDEVVVAPNIANNLVYNLEKRGFNITVGKNQLSRKYPEDVFYNAAVSEDFVICSKENIDEVLIEKLINMKKVIINVKQGYTKCSVCFIDSNSIVTSDKGIHNIVINKNIKSLLISPGDIELFNMNYGFIGGSSGKISNDEVAFYGNIKTHRDYAIIKSFIEKNNKKCISLSENKLIDLGTLIPLKEYNGI